MEVTPLRNNDLRRRTLIQQAELASPLRRTSSIATPPVVFSNDESERLKRRQSKAFQPQSPNESAKFLGEQDMKDHFEICTKLFSENKITTKNAWQLHIIDVLRLMSQKSNKDTLQVASTSLDISAKVYGIRVDDIHSNGLKLASNMARTTEKQTPHREDDGEAGENPENPEEEAATKKKKKKKRFTAGEKNTICKAPKTVLAPLPKLESVFFATRTNAGTSAIENLFTNMLPMDKSGHKFMLLSKDKAWPDGSDPLISENNGKKVPLTVNPHNNFTICFPFNDLEIDEWDPEKEEKIDADRSLLRQNEVLYDDNGIPIPELDGSIPDIFSNDVGDVNYDSMDEDQEEVEFVAQIQGDIAHIVDFTPDDMSKRTEYSYNTTLSVNGGVIDQIWAGPSHWKLKYIRRSTAKFSGQLSSLRNPEKISKQVKKKEFEFYNFNLFDEFSMAMNQVVKNRKKRHAEEQKITLPIQDTSCIQMIKNTSASYLKPAAAVLKKVIQNDESQEDENEIIAYKSENNNDSVCSLQNEEDDVHDYDDYESGDLIRQAQENFVGDNLVDAPEMVPQSYVPYALQAKKMDMKKLKTAVWQSLTRNEEIVMKDAHTREGKVNPTTFSKLYQDVPKVLPEKMKNELSSPLLFVALLHLCNEQNLVLKAHGDNRDFDVSG